MRPELLNLIDKKLQELLELAREIEDVGEDARILRQSIIQMYPSLSLVCHRAKRYESTQFPWAENFG